MSAAILPLLKVMTLRLAAATMFGQKPAVSQPEGREKDV
jgi:hypothetical protein